MKRLVKALAALLVALLVVLAVFAVPTVWGKPWSINHFYLRVLAVEFLHSPQLATQLGIQIPFVDAASQLDDYSVEARISDRPELMAGVSQSEIDDFTKTIVPIRISGPLASPSIRPDIEEVFRQQVEGAIEEETERLRNRLLQDLIGGDEEETEEDTEKDLEDQLKEKLLQDLIPR